MITIDKKPAKAWAYYNGRDIASDFEKGWNFHITYSKPTYKPTYKRFKLNTAHVLTIADEDLEEFKNKTKISHYRYEQEEGWSEYGLSCYLKDKGYLTDVICYHENPSSSLSIKRDTTSFSIVYYIKEDFTEWTKLSGKEKEILDKYNALVTQKSVLNTFFVNHIQDICKKYHLTYTKEGAIYCKEMKDFEDFLDAIIQEVFYDKFKALGIDISECKIYRGKKFYHFNTLINLNKAKIDTE